MTTSLVFGLVFLLMLPVAGIGVAVILATLPRAFARYIWGLIK